MYNAIESILLYIWYVQLLTRYRYVAHLIFNTVFPCSAFGIQLLHGIFKKKILYSHTVCKQIVGAMLYYSNDHFHSSEKYARILNLCHCPGKREKLHDHF